MPKPNKFSTDHYLIYSRLPLISDFLVNVSPNTITICNTIPTVIALYGFSIGSWGLFYPFFVLRYVIDCLDGFHARNHNWVSKYGSYLDHVQDFLFFVSMVFITKVTKGSIQTMFAMVPLAYFVFALFALVPSNFKWIHDNGFILLSLLYLLIF